MLTEILRSAFEVSHLLKLSYQAEDQNLKVCSQCGVSEPHINVEIQNQ
jgi:hypothetical protein